MHSIDDPARARILYGVSPPFSKSKWYKAWGDPRIPNYNLFNARDRNLHGVMRRKVANMYAMTTIKSIRTAHGQLHRPVAAASG